MNKDIYTQKIAFFNEELSKIRDILSGRTNEAGVLLTIAGLLSFLPQIALAESTYLLNFLTWTFWLLILAIAIYYPASLRITSIIKGQPFASTGSEAETEILKNRTEYLDIIWRKSVENHNSVMFWYSLAKGVIYAYIFSLVINFYIFVYYGSPSLRASVSILIISVLIAVILFVLPRLRSQKNKVVGEEKLV